MSSGTGLERLMRLKTSPDGMADVVIEASSDSQDFVEFLKAFPQTRFVFAARMRLRQIKKSEPIEPQL
jgi:hypothetical protein